MSAQKVAIVTGSNKGIGLAIVESLCKQLGSSWDVFVTARDEARGGEAVKQLQAKGWQAKFHQLDIDDTQSIDRLAAFLKASYGGLDILVNNAGIAYKGDSTAPFPEQAEVTVRTNFWGTLAVCERLFPLLRPHARVVHLGSTISDFTLNRCSPQMQARLLQPMSMEQVKALMTEFVEAAKSDKHRDLGWTQSAYGPSKVGVRLMTYAQAAEMASDKSRVDVVINGCCPGYVATDMSSFKGSLSVEEGAKTPVYLATLPENVGPELIGKHFYKCEVVPWAVGALAI